MKRKTKAAPAKLVFVASKPADGVKGWAAADVAKSLREGWSIFESSEYGFRIERLDEAEKFDGDGPAWLHVLAKAAKGSALHRRALAFIKKQNPAEYAEGMKFTGQEP